MYIKRIVVEEGTLHGLDLRFGPGLTVLIGPRGSGKTSVVELLRYCLGVPAYSREHGEKAQQRALAVLKSGKVSVTLDVDGDEVTYMRSASSDSWTRSATLAFQMPIFLSQSEIEKVGDAPESRLRLLDEFVASVQDTERTEEAARALVSSLTVELRGVGNEIGEIEDELARHRTVPLELAEARRQVAEANVHLEQATEQRSRLEHLSGLSAAAEVRQDAYRRAQASIATLIEAASALAVRQDLDAWPTAAGPEDRLALVREDLAAAKRAALEAHRLVAGASTKVAELSEREQERRVKLEDEARTLRSHLDELSEGVGTLMKQIADLEAREQRVAALTELAHTRLLRASEISGRREVELDELDRIRDSRVNSREHAASFLNQRLGPRIRFSVNRFGSLDAYREAISSAVRGSGIQHNVLAQHLAPLVSPRELVTLAESNDSASLVELTGLSLDRVQRAVQQLRDGGGERVLSAPLGDTVELSLLDGGTYKSMNEVSVGQRCTAVLPVLLSHTDRVLVVDQPEDNLDNSFIVDTLVKALLGRTASGQLILATHNPNVPVLGEADQVVLLASDGKRCWAQHVGVLDDPLSVEAITDVMEGGSDAFARRAAFYAQRRSTDEPG